MNIKNQIIMEVKGKIIKKFEASEYGSFKKIEFVLETEDKYPQTVKMQSTQERVPVIERLPVGTVADFHFNLRGREWTNPKGEAVYFTNLEVWKVDNIEEAKKPVKIIEDKSVDFEGDELPF